MSGARLALHLALELRRRGGGIGAAALCGGGGQGDALLLHVPPPDARFAGDPERLHVTRQVDPGELVEQARAGSARAVARLISLVEDDNPQLREVMAPLVAAYGFGHARSG